METDSVEATAAEVAVTAGDLSVDVLANVLGFLDGPKDIMRKRRVNKRWKEAVKMTIVPPSHFLINRVKRYIAMRVMAEAMPNLQQIKITYLRENRHIYNNGEDPDERRAAETAGFTALDIGIISNFSKLRVLDIYVAPLNGRYPILFSSFPLLQKLSIESNYRLKWDLEMLAGMPLLKELECQCNRCMTGNINSLTVLEDTLEKVKIYACYNVEGNFLDLADFPHLKELKLDDTAVTGDIRDIGENDFPSLEELALPKGVYGGKGCELRRISDAPELIRAIHIFKKQHPAVKMEEGYGKLSEDSLDWYDSADDDDDSPLLDTPPFHVRFVEAGSRVGYRWETNLGIPCEVNWLDPEPESGSSGYEDYIEKLQEIDDQVTIYKGFHQPPTEEEYQRIIEDYLESEESDN